MRHEPARLLHAAAATLAAVRHLVPELVDHDPGGVGRALLERPVLAKLVGSRVAPYVWPDGRRTVLGNHNHFVGQVKLRWRPSDDLDIILEPVAAQGHRAGARGNVIDLLDPAA